MRKVFLSILVLAAVTAWGQFEHPDFKSGKKHINSVVLMPVQADITRVSMKGPEPMVEESRRVEKELTPVISQVLKKLGCSVNDSAATAEALGNDPELKYVIDDLQKQFDATMGQMVKKSKDVRKGRFSLGDSVTKLPAGENVDAILFVRASGQVLTGGKKAFGLLIGGPAYDMVGIDVGVVDSKSGDVLYFAKPFMLKNLAKDPADARSGIEKSFKNFVKANAAGGTSSASSTAVASNTPTSPAKAEPPAAAKPDAALVASALPSATPKTFVANEPAPVAAVPVAASVNVNTPADTRSKLYVFVQRTARHVKYSDQDVFTNAIAGIREYFKAKNYALVAGTEGISSSEFETSVDKVIADAKSAKADSILYIKVDRPVTKWIEFQVQCLDNNGKELWNAKTGSGGGFTGGHGLKVGLEHLSSELDKRAGQPGLPVASQAQATAEGK